MSSDQKNVTFTVEQIDWLEKQFPERMGLYEDREMVLVAGQRSVLQRIKQVSRVETRNVPIPARVS